MSYLLRTCNADMTSHGGFVWPRSGHVEAPDWDPKPKCGHGLHGLLNGEGDGSLLDWSPEAVWLVVEVDKFVDLGGKVKAQRGIVVHCGTRETAAAWLVERCPGRAVVGVTVTAGNGGTATAGDGGTATAGYHGTATAGNGGTATAGYHGTATAGNGGTATAGDDGTATAGNGGTATAGYHGTVQVRWSDGERCRTCTGYVGEGGIVAGVAYKVVNGRLVKA